MSLKKAISLAQQRQKIISRGSSNISRMVAILTDGNSTFTGENSYRTHPLVQKFKTTEGKECVHAEIAAIIKARYYFTKIAGTRRDSYVTLRSFRMYIARVLADGTPALAAPCPECQTAMEYFQIKDVFWTT